jgi:hypothetical protein
MSFPKKTAQKGVTKYDDKDIDKFLKDKGNEEVGYSSATMSNEMIK